MCYDNTYLSTASYVSINKAISSLDKVRQRIFSVDQINTQAYSDLYLENLIYRSYKTMPWGDPLPDASLSSFFVRNQVQQRM